VDVAERMNPDGDGLYMRALTAFRESVTYRILKKPNRSYDALEPFCSSIPEHVEGQHVFHRTHAQLGLVQVAWAKMLLQRDDPGKAATHLRKWISQSPQKLSTLERLTMREVNVTIANALRYQGDFAAAREYLEDMLTEADANDVLNTGHVDLLCNLGDVYCELNNPGKARELLSVGLGQLRAMHSKNSPWLTRLNLSLAETYLRQSSTKEAEEVLEQIQECSQRGYHLTSFQKLRLQVSMARIAHLRRNWSTALRYWTGSLQLIEEYPFGVGHTTRVIHYSISTVLSELGELELSSKSLAESEKMLRSGGCVHWIAGLTSYWDKHVRSARSIL